MESVKKILIVEDEIVIAMDLQITLEQYGYAVSGHVTKGEEVIAAVEKSKPDLILMDIMLDGTVDGVETAQMIHENYDIPVIFLTSFSNKNIVERAKKTNPFGYIVKPFVDRELITNIEIAFYKHDVELKLKESERKYRQLAESIQHIILECDKEGVIRYLNQPGMEMLGMATSEIEKGVSITAYIAKSEFEQIKSRIASHKKNDNTLSNREHLLINKYGKRFFIEEYLSPIYDHDEIIGYRGLCVDITSKKFKDSLYYLYNKLTLVYNEAKVDPFELVSFLLSEFKNYFSYIEDVFFNEYQIENKKIIKHVVGQNESREYSSGLTEFVIESKKPLYLRGQELTKFYPANNIPVRNPKDMCWAGFPVNFQNKPYGVFVFKSIVNQNALLASDFENLTIFFNNVNALLERISYLKEIQQSEEQYKFLVNSINEGIIQLDAQSRVTFVNDQLCKLTGCAKNQLIGRNIQEFFSLTQSDEELLKNVKERRNSGLPSQYELKLLCCDGMLKDFSVNSTPVRNANKEIIGALDTYVDITEKKQQSRLIEESEERFREIANTIKAAFWVYCWQTKKILYLNPAVKEIFEVSFKSILNAHTWRECIHPEDREFVINQFCEKAPHEGYNLQYRIITPNGKLKWIEEKTIPVRNSDGEVIRIIGYSFDITPNKSAEENLRKSENEKENILRSIPDSFMVIDVGGKILNAYFKNNEKLTDNIEDCIEKNISEVFPESIVNTVMHNILNCIRFNNTFFEELTIEKDGESQWFELRFAPINISSVLMIVRNVTETKKNVLEIQKFYNIIQQTNEIIVITDKDGLVEYINPMFTKTAGYEMHEVLGKKTSILKTNKHPRSFFTELWNTILSGQTFKAEFHNKKKDGGVYIEQKIITPLLNEHGEIINFISTGRDVTEERQKEKKILTYQKFEKTLEKKEQKYRLLSLIQGQEKERKRIAMEIHDGIGQMLTVANANIGSLQMNKIRSTEEKLKIQIAGQLIVETLQELRGISHNLSPAGLYEFGLHAVLNQFITRINQNPEKARITFKSNITKLRFKSELEINLYRIIQEAIQNALKHSRASIIELSILFEKNVLRLKIKDNGVGVNLKSFESANKHFNGIRNMDERAKSIGAKFRYFSEKNNGFEIETEIKAKNIIK